MLLEACILGTLKAICGIGRTVENEKSKRDTAKLTPEGYVRSIGRTGQVYYNGEQTYEWTERDKYGRSHNLTIGMNSGKVYSDDYDRWMQHMIEDAEKRKQDAIKRNFGGYEDWDVRFNKLVLRELSTGKIITCLREGVNIKTKKPEYRKWYLTDEVYKKYGKQAYCCTADGDMGIVIPKEEFIKLGFIGSPSKIPSDLEVEFKLLGMR